MAVHHEINEILENVRQELPSRLHGVFEDAVQRAAEGQKQGRKRIEREIRYRSPWERQKRRYQQEEGALAIFALVVGFLGGLAFKYLFDPERGEQRRAMLRGEAERLADKAEDAADQTADTIRGTSAQVRSDVNKAVDSASASVKDATTQANKAATGVGSQVNKMAANASDSLKEATNQVKATAAEVKQRVESAATSDATVLARVRVEVARGVRSPGAVEVDVKDGVVSLTGQIRSGEVQALVEKITAISGVRSVDNRLEVHDAVENSPASPNGTPNGTA